MVTVFLGKSLKTPVDEFNKVLSVLQTLDCKLFHWDFEQTPEWNHDVLRNCDHLILISHAFDLGGYYHLGKGLYNMIEEYAETSWDYAEQEWIHNNPPLIVSSVGETEIYVDEILSWEVEDINDYRSRYGSCNTNAAVINLTSYISPKREPVEKKSPAPVEITTVGQRFWIKELGCTYINSTPRPMLAVACHLKLIAV